MELGQENNAVRLVGTVASAAVFSHENRGTRFFLLPLSVERLSGVRDELHVLLRETQLASLECCEAERLCVEGELRSFNDRSGTGARLRLAVFARRVAFCGDEDENEVLLRGALCKEPRLRRTPMGREICDLMLAVRRRYARSDYLPCICWGEAARQAALWPVGAGVLLRGRLQSRRYIKQTEYGPLERTAYEVSAAALAPLDADAQSSPFCSGSAR